MLLENTTGCSILCVPDEAAVSVSGLCAVIDQHTCRLWCQASPRRMLGMADGAGGRAFVRSPLPRPN